MLELRFVSTLEENIDAHIRAYLRGDTAQRDRQVDSVWGAFWGGLGASVMLRLFEGKWPALWLILLFLVCGYVLYFVTFRYNVASRIARDVRKRRGKEKPPEVLYRISGGELHVWGPGVENIYQIEDIDWVGKDEHYLEFRFRDMLHFALPLRLFGGEVQGVEDGETYTQASLEDFVAGLGVEGPEKPAKLLDLTQGDGGLEGSVEPPKPKDVHGGVQMSTLPLWVAAFACTALGLTALILCSKMAGMEGATSPLGLMGMGMTAVGVISGIVLFALHRRRLRQKNLAKSKEPS